MNIRKIFSIVLLFIPMLASSQEVIMRDQKPYIEVTGIAEKEIVPDQIYIDITLKERPAGKDKQSVEEQEKNLKAALTKNGFDLKDLYLSDANADYVKVRVRTRDVVTKKEFTFKVKDANEVGKVFQLLDELKIEDGYISKVNHSQIDSLKKTVRIMAVKAAKDKADYLLAAVNEHRGKTLMIQEIDYGVPMYDANVRMKSMEEQMQVQDTGPAIEFRKIKIEARMNVRFEIN